MLLFPNAKINIGLNIVSKRKDNYHNIESVFYPILGLYDAIEMVRSTKLSLEVVGEKISEDIEDNLVIKSYKALQKDFKLPSVSFYLKKNIPMGAGLGGGSSDAAFAIKMINDTFNLGLSLSQLEKYALRIGADSPFFIQNRTCIAKGKGEILTPIDLDLKGKTLMLVKPNISVNTAEAYRGITPKIPEFKLDDINQLPVKEWKNFIKNDFEDTIFTRYPILEKIKKEMYYNGALYASMSGSGATIYGIFDSFPSNIFKTEKYFKKILTL